MKWVIFGLSVSSSWGNGHATLWRGLLRALGGAGHEIVFFERDVPYYAAHRDDWSAPGCRLVLYGDLEAIRLQALLELDGCDVAIATSYCPEGAARLVLESRATHKVFYDLDTPVTLARLADGERVEYLPPEGLGGFDLVLSYTGGRALDGLRDRLGARVVAPLYGSVDPAVHVATARSPWRAALSYLGTYAADRQSRFERLFLGPARRCPQRRFLLGGPQYPSGIDWPANVQRVEHVSPHQHAAFYAAAPLTLSITRASMAALGYCPSGRLFEAAACGVPVLSDSWEGLDTFFSPGREILIAEDEEDVLSALARGPEALSRLGRAARERTLAEHTAERRARQLLALIEGDTNHAGNHPRGGSGQSDSALGLLQGASARR